MNKKRQYKTYPKVFKEEAVALVEQGYSRSSSIAQHQRQPALQLEEEARRRKQRIHVECSPKSLADSTT